MSIASRVLTFTAVLGACWIGFEMAARSADAQPNVYAERILVANRPGLAADAIVDPHLLNPWGDRPATARRRGTHLDQQRPAT